MSKNWISAEIIFDKNGKPILVEKKNKITENKRTKKLNLRTVKSLSYDELKKEGDKAYYKRREAEDHLVDAYKNKKLQSADLIKNAKAITARREKEAEEAARKAAEKDRRDKLVSTDTAIA